MKLKSQYIKILGVSILLLGGTGFASGGYIQADYDCTSGEGLAIESVDEYEISDVANTTLAFENLSAVEQRIFLEAYTDGDDSTGFSEIYQNWSASWFEDGGASADEPSPTYVAYRGNYYQLRRVHADCAPSLAPFVRIAGIVGLLLGVGIVAVGHVRQRHEQ